MDEKLKPCPFCGVNGLPHPLDHKEGCYLRYFYEILAERASTSGDVMREAWNTRAERTCRNDNDNDPSRFRCSRCGWQDWDTYTADSAFSYCPNCRAKVVE